jgi:hypothetical protein
MAIRNSQDITLVVFSGQPNVRVSQDITLVVFSGQPNVRVSQDITLVAYTRLFGPATQLLTFTDPGFGFKPVIRRNQGLFQTASTLVYPTTRKVFPIVFCVT